MPSYDPITGKRLGGQAQQASAGPSGRSLDEGFNAAEDLPVPAALLGLLAPPERGVAAVEAWARGLNLRAGVALLQDPTEEEALGFSPRRPSVASWASSPAARFGPKKALTCDVSASGFPTG